MIARRASRWLMAGALALVPVLAPSVAWADDQLQLSTDDQHWRTDLDQPLFNAARRWVPGGAATATFWIRNTADTDGRLVVATTLHGGDQLLQQGLRLRARAADHPWTTLPVDGSGRALDADVAAGTATRIWVTASLPATADDTAADRHLDLRLQLTLTQVTTTGPPAHRSGPGGALASTGLDPDALGLAMAGLTALVAGAVALRSRHRIDRDQGRDGGHV